MCDHIARVCKELKFQFYPIEKLDLYYKYALQCFQDYIAEYKNAVKDGDHAAGPQQIATWYTSNAETLDNINSTFLQCLDNSETKLYAK